MVAPKTKKIELLAPAKDFAHGQMALLCGADALYVGAPMFGARAGAGASLEDITGLCSLAHLYGAKVYVAMNTLLYDSELDVARKVAWDVYKAGADALIVQDMAFVAMDDMPDIALHSSTQMCNNDPRVVEFLHGSGFSRVILERALSLEDTAAISASCDVEIEAFVHGAICVCNSGRCYMSLSMGSGRSGNRGDCMQSCRMPYQLLDRELKPIKGFSGKHLLSISDMNRSGDLREMIDAGVSSFKIEGRLKDMAYVKNIVSYYRRELDAIISSDNGLERASCGRSMVGFEPNPQKSFARGATSYFLNTRKGKIATFDSPKSSGYYIGEVSHVGRDYIVVDGLVEPLENGDGICFYDRQSVLCGTNINKVDGKRIYPNRLDGITSGTKIYKNFDRTFSLALAGCMPRRVRDVVATFSFSEQELSLSLECGGMMVESRVENEFSPARNIELAERTITTQIKKSSHSAFDIVDVKMPEQGVLPFVAVSLLNSLRRDALELLEVKLSETKYDRSRGVDNKPCYPYKIIAQDNSIVNELAKNFFLGRGVEMFESPLEASKNFDMQRVMTCRYCVRREIGACLKDAGAAYNKVVPRSELYVRTGPHTYKLGFDCKKCEMYILKYGK
ncbi:MAG: U32 family peptidase [Rikenellaceae bacterium]